MPCLIGLEKEGNNIKGLSMGLCQDDQTTNGDRVGHVSRPVEAVARKQLAVPYGSL